MDFMHFLKRTLTVSISSLILFTASSHAASIEDSSVNWHDATARDKLLTNAPQWSTDTINLIYAEYLHPERHHLPSFINGVRPDYNALFVNAFWGPVENSFVKYPRPAKVFIFYTDNNNIKRYDMALVIKNETGNYFIFDKAQTQPTPLNDWVYSKSNGFRSPVNVNVCNGYGVLPQDSCTGESYEGEIYTYPELTKSGITSSKRALNEDWRKYADSQRPADAPAGLGAYDQSVPWNDAAKRKALLDTVVTWPSYTSINNNFKKIRDYRFYRDENNSTFKRRISWLYPDDGCYSRAASVLKDLFGPLGNMVNRYERPSKVFAFGSLCVNTANHPEGYVSWWYHVAPVVRDVRSKYVYVIDPAVNPYKPVNIDDWMKMISANSGACGSNPKTEIYFNICNGYGIAPYDKCELSFDNNFETEIRGMLLQKAFRRLEKDRQVELKRDPDKVLGDSPPWV